MASVVRRRRTALIVLLVGVVASTSACSPIWTGALGVTRDEAGEVILIAVTCDAELDHVQLRVPNESQYVAPETVGSWEHDGALSGTVTVALTAPDESDGWTATQSWNDVGSKTTYDFWVDRRSLGGSSPVIGPLGFQGKALDEVGPGEILQNTNSGRSVVLTQTVDEFAASACD